MKEKPNILLDRQTLSFKALTNEIKVSNSGQLICTIIGVSLIPVQIKIKPLEIKNSLVRKNSENQIDIQNKLFQGSYFVNVLDYTLGEVALAGNIICEKWSKLIWSLLKNKEPEKKKQKSL